MAPALDAGSLEAAAPVDYGNPVRDATFEWGTYVFPSSHPCLKARPEGKPPDLSRQVAQVQPYERVQHAFEEAKKGHVVRVTFKSHGAGGVSGPALPIQLEERVGGFDELSPAYLPGLGAGRAGRELLDFVLVGYFTGREISLHEHYRDLQLPADWAVKNSESHPDPDRKFPEFCLEAWCTAVPTHHLDDGDQEFARCYARSLTERSREHQKMLLQSGVPSCTIR